MGGRKQDRGASTGQRADQRRAPLQQREPCGHELCGGEAVDRAAGGRGGERQ